MNTTKFWITSLASVATAGSLGLAIAQNTYSTPQASEQKMDQGGSTAGGAAAQEPAAPKSDAAVTAQASGSSSSTTSAEQPAEQPVAKADRG